MVIPVKQFEYDVRGRSDVGAWDGMKRSRTPDSVS